MAVSYTLVLSFFYLASGIFIFLLGLTILRTGTGGLPMRATALMLFFAGAGPILTASSILLQSTLGPQTAFDGAAVDNFEYLWEFFFPSLLLFALTYPRENRNIPNLTILVIVLFAPYIVHLFTIMSGERVFGLALGVADRLSTDRTVSVAGRDVSFAGVGNVVSAIFSSLVNLHRHLFLLVNMSYAGAAILVIFRGMRIQVNPRIAGQLRTVAVGVTVGIGAYMTAKVMALLPSDPVPEGVILALVNLGLIAGGGSVAYAVIRQQFLGIRYVTRKSILYGAAAVFFAIVYLVVVKPVSDFFGQYSVAGKEAFETGFIILAILAFQPTLFRIEELLERLLLKGREDPQTMVRQIGSQMATATTERELERYLLEGFQRAVDASRVELHLDASRDRFRALAPLLEEIGEPLTRGELLKLGERGGLNGAPTRREKPSRDEARLGLERARSLAGDDEVLVPVLKDAKCVGYLGIGEKTIGLKYANEELALLSMVSDQIGIALENIRLLRENVEKKVLEEELQMARRIQRQLLPGEAPAIPGWELAASTVPSRQVGGDYYDFDLVDDHTLVVVVADVSGKGIPASLLMATLHAAVNSNEDVKRRPSLMLRRINELLYASTSAEEFATLFYGVVDLADGRITYANAGHEFPFVTGGSELLTLDESGIVLGCIPSHPYEAFSRQLPAGGGLVLYTDGITDAARSGGERFGETRLRDALEACRGCRAPEVRDEILARVGGFAEGGDYRDDLTLVVLRRG